MGAVGTVGIPVVLTHAQMIVPAQLALALPSALLLGATLVAYDWLSRRSEELYGY
jgi:lipopolysaccharide export LptBFGC system permease protein LptF